MMTEAAIQGTNLHSGNSLKFREMHQTHISISWIRLGQILQLQSKLITVHVLPRSSRILRKHWWLWGPGCQCSVNCCLRSERWVFSATNSSPFRTPDLSLWEVFVRNPITFSNWRVQHYEAGCTTYNFTAVQVQYINHDLNLVTVWLNKIYTWGV